MDPDTGIFVIDLQDAKIKFERFFCLLLFEGTFTSFFKDKKSQEAVAIKVFLTIFSW
jgi:hypothetical protein